MTPNLSYLINVACHAHKGQVRRYTGEPYIIHLSEVAMLTERWLRMVLGPPLPPTKLDPIVRNGVAIAWCHDLIEDTTWEEAEFREMVQAAGFDPIVADGVVALTDEPAVPGGPNRAERKRRTIARMSQADILVQLVKLADGHSNAHSIRAHDPDFYEVFREEKRALIEQGLSKLKSDTGFAPIVQLVLDDLKRDV